MSTCPSQTCFSDASQLQPSQLPSAVNEVGNSDGPRCPSGLLCSEGLSLFQVYNGGIPKVTNNAYVSPVYYTCATSSDNAFQRVKSLDPSNLSLQMNWQMCYGNQIESHCTFSTGYHPDAVLLDLTTSQSI